MAVLVVAFAAGLTFCFIRVGSSALAQRRPQKSRSQKTKVPPKPKVDYTKFSHTTHTVNIDTYERILENDVKKNVVEVAWCVYQLAMRDDLLPRFTKDAMPKPPLVETTTAPAPPRTKPAAKPRRTTRRRPNGALRVPG